MKNRMMNRQHRLDAALRGLNKFPPNVSLRKLLPQPRGKVPCTG